MYRDSGSRIYDKTFNNSINRRRFCVYSLFMTWSIMWPFWLTHFMQSGPAFGFNTHSVIILINRDDTLGIREHNIHRNKAVHGIEEVERAAESDQIAYSEGMILGAPGYLPIIDIFSKI